MAGVVREERQNMGRNAVAAQREVVETLSEKVERLNGLPQESPAAKRLKNEVASAMSSTVKAIARTFRWTQGTLATEDLEQAGFVALFRCAMRFRLSPSGTTFEKWAEWNVRRAMHDHVRAQSRDVHVSDHVGRGRRRVDGDRITGFVELDAPVEGTSETPEHSSATPAAAADDALQAAQTRALLRRFMHRLEPALADLLQRHYGLTHPEGKEVSIREIARDTGASRARLDAMLKRGQRMLGQMLERELNARRSS